MVENGRLLTKPAANSTTESFVSDDKAADCQGDEEAGRSQKDAAGDKISADEQLSPQLLVAPRRRSASIKSFEPPPKRTR
jgi:hypothetical protein